MNIKADYKLDFRGSITPIILLKITQMFRKMRPNDIIEIQGSDPDIQRDLFKVLPQGAYELMRDVIGDDEGQDVYYRILLKKRKRSL